MSPTQMVSQTSTLTMVQDLQSLLTTVTTMQSEVAAQSAQSLIGHTVSYTSPSGTSASGVVSGVTLGSSGPTLTISGQQIDPSTVTAVTS
jgi:flagellar basal-body rod modification protein FlgD